MAINPPIRLGDDAALHTTKQCTRARRARAVSASSCRGVLRLIFLFCFNAIASVHQKEGLQGLNEPPARAVAAKGDSR